MDTLQTVLLRLEGPIQAWGLAAPWSQRPTEHAPTKSGVLGLVGAALGLTRDSQQLIELPRHLRMGVRVDLPGSLLTEFQTVGGGGSGVPTAQLRPDGTPKLKKTESTGQLEIELSHRGYLVDASFLVALAGPQQLVTAIHQALQRPRWLLYLGRKACLPSAPLAAGISEHDDPVAALKAAPLHRATRRGAPIWLIWDSDPVSGQIQNDVPLDPSRRRFGPRWVEQGLWLPPPQPSELNTLWG